MKPWDVAIVGGGILGTTLAYWLSTQYDARVAVIEQEAEVAEHASQRNTGVIHRPFYLHPERSRLFAQSSLLSYDLWRRYALQRGLPWKVVGTLKLALREEEVHHLETCLHWSEANGLEEGELELLGHREVGELEPHVRCLVALHAKRETSVDFGAFTRELRKDAQANGVRFLMRRRVSGLTPTPEGVELEVEGRDQPHQSTYVINCAGGDAVDLAHSLGVGLRYTDLHFRGDYWRVSPGFAHLARHNLYPVPRQPEFPFLDPHWVVRASGDVEIGPTAVPVAGPLTYSGFYESPSALLRKAFEPPLESKARLLAKPALLKLASQEILGALSRSITASRVRKFLPEFRDRMISDSGISGIRNSVLDLNGEFLKEVLEMHGPYSTHVLNYNSPGATGAPAYTAFLVDRLRRDGFLDHLRPRSEPQREPWDLTEVLATQGRRGGRRPP